MSNDTAAPSSSTGLTQASAAQPEFAVRPLVYSDLPAVLAIERRSFETPWSLAMFVLELSKPSGICLAIRLRGHPRGYLVCSRYTDVWHLMNIAVVPERRREGIATELMGKLFEARERRRGSRSRSGSRTRRAIQMYEGFGFKPAGHRRRYYHDNGEDALIMWRE